jgi:hypothetical protein
MIDEIGLGTNTIMGGESARPIPKMERVPSAPGLRLLIRCNCDGAEWQGEIDKGLRKPQAG